MKRFLEALFPNTDHGFIELRCISSEGPIKHRAFTASIEEAEQLSKDWRNDGHVYFGVVLRPKKQCTKEVVAGSPCTAVWVDLDAETTDDTDKRNVLKNALGNFVLPPSFAVDTGRGYHLYWLLSKSVPADDALEEVVARVGEKVGGDTVSDITRIMRVPGTLNHKTDPPTPCSLLFVKPQYHYALEDLVAATMVDRKTGRRVATGYKRGFKSRSERDWAIIIALIQAGLSNDAIERVFQVRRCGDKVRDKNGSAYFAHTLQEARGQAQLKAQSTSPLEFVEHNDCYWQKTIDGSLIQLSTFTFHPDTLLRGDAKVKHDAIVGSVHASGYEWLNVILTKPAFSNTDAMLKQLPVAAWQWLGKDTSVRALLPHLMDKLRDNGLPKKQISAIVGRIGDVWVAPKQTITKSRVIPAVEAEIFWVPTGQQELLLDYQTCTDAEFTDLVTQFVPLLAGINKPEVVYPALGWYLAAPWKTRFEQAAYRFPHLNIFGTRGGGKTTLNTRVMQPLLGVKKPQLHDAGTTRFVMLTLLGCTNGIPITLSEFRFSLLHNTRQLLRYLLLAYDSGRDQRGRTDQSVVDYELAAPIVVDGEDAIGDPAALERIIAICLSPETIREGTTAYKAFHKLVELPLTLFGARWIMYTLQNEPPIAQAQALVDKTFERALPERVRRNVAVCVAGLLAVHQFLTSSGSAFPVPDESNIHWWFGPMLDHLVGEYGGRTKIALDDLVTEAVMQIEVDLNNVRPTEFAYKYHAGDNTVWVNLTSLLQWWDRIRRQRGRSTLDSAALKVQLRERTPTGYDDDTGQYIVSTGKPVTHSGNSVWMFGVDLTAAHQVLDVPDKLHEPFSIVTGDN